MRKLLVVLMVVGLLVSGCAGFKNIFCSPAATLVTAAVSAAAQIAALQTVYPIGTTIGNALNAALPNITSLKDGYCVSDQDNFLVYVQGLIDGADKAAVAMKMQTAASQPYKGLKAMGLKP